MGPVSTAARLGGLAGAWGAAVLLAAGCATTKYYLGPSVPKEQLAIIQTDSVCVHEVNGRPVGRWSQVTEAQPGTFMEYRVLPGPCRVVVSCAATVEGDTLYESTARHTLVFETRAASIYHLLAKSKGNTYSFELWEKARGVTPSKPIPFTLK